MNIETKTCSHCKLDLPLNNFGKRKAVNNYKSVGKYHSHCKPCAAKIAKEWRQKNKGYRGSGKYKSIPEEDRKLRSCLSQRISDAKGRERKRNISIEVDNYMDIDFLMDMWKNQKGLCSISGEPMDIIKNSLGNVSIDKIDPYKTYTKDNVHLVCWAINRAKGEMPLDIFIEMCSRVVKQNVQRLSKG